MPKKVYTANFNSFLEVVSITGNLPLFEKPVKL